MNEVARLLLLLLLSGAAVTLAGGGAIWFNDETRRIRRGLKRVLDGAPHAMVAARGTGRGVGFNFSTNMLATAWDAGGWCLLYRVDELVGAELIVDGQVAARVHRGENRRALDVSGGAEKLVRLRLVFDDPAHPDFDLDLWTEAQKDRRGAISPADAIQEANRWIARTEALLRRPPGPGTKPAPTPIAEPAARPAPATAVAPPPVMTADDEPPFDMDGEPETLDLFSGEDEDGDEKDDHRV